MFNGQRKKMPKCCPAKTFWCHSDAQTLSFGNKVLMYSFGLCGVGIAPIHGSRGRRHIGEIQNNFQVSSKILKRLTRRLKSNPDQLERYSRACNEMLERKEIEKLEESLERLSRPDRCINFLLNSRKVWKNSGLWKKALK